MKNGYAHTVARTLAAILALALSLALVGAAAETYAVVTGTNALKLRADAGSGSRWLGAYDRGVWVTVTGSKNNFYGFSWRFCARSVSAVPRACLPEYSLFVESSFV
jgi:hypothetical protein